MYALLSTLVGESPLQSRRPSGRWPQNVRVMLLDGTRHWTPAGECMTWLYVMIYYRGDVLLVLETAARIEISFCLNTEVPTYPDIL